ncbi:quinone oxidoreductase-like protein 2 [Sagmatias obliquidens]|uniref:quinone oxidoreductase-like protein 2 n=1 Tax=Sagmatias obliquidens TaxID=3371155 RepID=UPI000F43F8E2|nr:quinone oxidoreductase-like protein 2 [Lagenorhynchus obliquidens]
MSKGAPGDQGARAPGRSAAPPRVRLARGAVPAADASLGRVASPRRPGRGGRRPALPAALGPPPLSTLAWGPGVGVGVGTVLASGVALQVRVDVHFCGVNFADILACRDQYQEMPQLPFTSGMEFSGTVLETGTDVSTVKEALWQIPERVPLREAAALPVSYGTATLALERQAHTQPGEAVLVTAAAGATGRAAIDVAASVLQVKLQPCKLAMQRGAQSIVSYSQSSLKEAVGKLVGSGGVNVVIDTVEGDIFLEALRSLAWEGRIVVVGFAGGTIASVPASLLLLKNISAMGLYWGRYQDQNFPLFFRDLSSAIQYCQEGCIQPYIGAVFKLEEVRRS